MSFRCTFKLTQNRRGTKRRPPPPLRPESGCSWSVQPRCTPRLNRRTRGACCFLFGVVLHETKVVVRRVYNFHVPCVCLDEHGVSHPLDVDMLLVAVANSSFFAWVGLSGDSCLLVTGTDGLLRWAGWWLAGTAEKQVEQRRAA